MPLGRGRVPPVARRGYTSMRAVEGFPGTGLPRWPRRGDLEVAVLCGRVSATSMARKGGCIGRWGWTSRDPATSPPGCSEIERDLPHLWTIPALYLRLSRIVWSQGRRRSARQWATAPTGSVLEDAGVRLSTRAECSMRQYWSDPYRTLCDSWLVL